VSALVERIIAARDGLKTSAPSIWVRKEARDAMAEAANALMIRDEVIACLREVERAFLADVKPSTISPDGDNVIYHLDGQTVGGALARTRRLLSAMGSRP
jgi:hypothetical protein